jgi:hypothetical protein
MEPRAFQFADVDLGFTDEDGEPFTSAVLNEVDWAPPINTMPDKPAGKNQSQALDILKRLWADCSRNQGDEGRVLEQAWREECYTVGINQKRFWDIKNTLSRQKKIIIQDSFVFLSGNPSASPSASGGYYISPRMRADGGMPDKTSETDGNGWARMPDIPQGITPEDFKACYETAYPVFLKEGCTPQEADQKARAEIQKQIDAMKAEPSRVQGSPPAVMADPAAAEPGVQEVDF